MAGRRGMVSGGGAGGGGGGGLGPIASLTFLGNPTGAPAVPTAQSMTAAVFLWAALALGAADTVVKVNGGGTALEYGKITANNISDGAVTLAKLANGTNPGALLWWTGAAWIETASGTVETDGTSISFGSNPSASGVIRLSATSHIWAKTGGGTDVILIGETGGNVEIGMNNAAVAVILSQVGTGGIHRWSVAGSVEMSLNNTTLDLNQNSITDASFIEVGGGTVAGAGTIRTANATSIIYSKTSGGADAQILRFDSSNNILFGSTGADAIILNVATGGSHFLQVNGSTEYTFSSTTLDLNQNSITDASFVELGSGTMSTAGLIRTPNNVSLWRPRNAGNTDNPDLLSFNASDKFFVGDAATANMDLRVASGGVIGIVVAGGTEYSFSASTFDCNQNSITDVGFIALGTDPATSGAVRLTNNDLLGWKTSGGTTLQMLQLSSADLLIIGSSNAAHLNTDVHVGASGGTLQLKFAGATEYSFTTTGLDCNQNSITDLGFMELGPTPVATAGQLRVHNQFQLQARNGANTNDYLVLWLNGDFITLGNGGTVTAGLILQGGNGSIEFHSNAGGTRAEMTSSHFRLTDIPLTWGNTYSIPTVQQEIDTAASSATNRTLTLAAQDKSGTTNVTACDVLVRGGDATGASGTRNGGDCISRAGTGVTQDGSWQVLSAGAIIAEVARVANTRRVFAFCRAAPLTTSQMPTNTGDMVMYVGNATIAPSFVVGTNPPASGVIVFSEAACLSTVNSGNVRYDLCPADQGGTSNITTSKVVLRSARTNTANATPVNLDTFTPGTNTVVVVIARVRARDRTADDHAGYVLHACFKRRAAGTTIVGAVAATLTAESDATWAATLDTDGANAIRVRITGDATNVVDWDVDWEIHYTTV